jgi:two-component sensor histidine kinase
MVEQIRSSYAAERGKVGLTVKASDVHLNVEVAIPCGMIVHELVTNALQHAFPDGAGGRVVVELRAEVPRLAVLTVEDNGRGLPTGALPGEGDGLGLQLVRMLVDQLRGVVRVSNAGGARFRIAFPQPDEEGVA